MKTIVSLAICTLWVYSMCAQSPQFYKAIDPHPENTFWIDQGLKTFQTDSFYYTLARYKPDRLQSMVVKLNKQGDIVHQKELTTAYNNLTLVDGFQAPDHSLILIGNYIDWDWGSFKSVAMLVKVDKDLNLQWMKSYVNPDNTDGGGALFGTHVIQTDDQQNYVFSANSFDRSFLYRTDLNGNVISIHALPDSISTEDGNIIKSPDDNLVCSGKLTTATETVNMVFKMDLQGNILWSQPINTFALSTTITPLQNGKYGVCSLIDSILDYPPQGRQITLSIVSENGIIEQTMQLPMHYQDEEIRDLTTASNGDIIGCGKSEIAYEGWLFRATSEGSLLWQRHFSDSLQRPWSPVSFLNVLGNSDGSIVLTGFLYDSMPGLNPYDPENRNINISMMVTDADGCLTPGCPSGLQYITSAPEVSGPGERLPWLQVSPNPANDLLRVRIPEGANGTVVLYNLWGQVALRRNIDSGSGWIEMDSGGLPAGCYSVAWLVGGQVMARNKVIIQH